MGAQPSWTKPWQFRTLRSQQRSVRRNLCSQAKSRSTFQRRRALEKGSWPSWAGVGVPRAAEPVADLSENVRLSPATEDYAWVNMRQIWGYGTVNFATDKIHVDAYMQ